jgi:hypothetical protein
MHPVTVKSDMAEVINLRTARKQQKRRQEKATAAANRLSFGRTKAERTAERARAHKAERTLDQHRIESGADR